MLNENDDWVGEIAHIRGAKKGSARFDASMTNEERRAYDNLLILCPTHHEQVDTGNGRLLHTVTELEQVKKQHEDRFRRVIATIAESQDEYVDLTRRNVVKPCTTLARLLPEQDIEDIGWNVEVVNRFAGELRRVTLAARGLLSTVVEFGGRIGVPEAARRADTTEDRVRKLALELDRFKLAYIDYEDDEIPERLMLWMSQNHPVLDGWDLWDDLRRCVAECTHLTIDDVIVRLDFSSLD
ncbi:hypothetical protein ACIPM5_35095 [Streptomyces microflavus]|uniref:hypothetical protein n=1 Tax=Streptomyces microflavus TaxID=1919 RepID=UPI003808F89B